MKLIQFTPDSLKEIIAVLKNGGVVAHPADTCFGLTANLMNRSACKKIQMIKGRDYNNPMSIMISVLEHLKIGKYVKLDKFSSFAAKKLFPGAVTIVLPKGEAIPDYYFPNLKTVGLRVPLHNLTQDILIAFNGPLITTSANPSGEDLCFSHTEVIKAFKKNEVKPDIVIKGKISGLNQASTVISIEKNRIRIMRSGPVTASQLRGILGLEVEGE